MTNDLVQWAGAASPIGVGEIPGGDLVAGAQPPPGMPDPRLKKPRHRPNRGRKRRRIGPYLAEIPWGVLRETGYPLPPDIDPPLSKVPAQWRRGPQYVHWRLSVFAIYGTTCHLCGHPNADSADHLVPLSKWGNQPYDPRLSRPAHGVAGCPTCGVKCNSSRGNAQFAQLIRDYQPPVAL